MKNRFIADMFNRMADVLEFQDESPFKTNAYRKAGRVLSDLQEGAEVPWRERRLKDIPGIGEGLAGKIDDFLRTGRMARYDEIAGAEIGTAMEINARFERLDLSDVNARRARRARL